MDLMTIVLNFASRLCMKSSQLAQWKPFKLSSCVCVCVCVCAHVNE